MTGSADGAPTNILRAAVNSPRGIVVMVVAGLSAVGGAVAGALAALIAAAVLTPSAPTSAADITLMAIEYGVIAGIGGGALGTFVAFGALRRVPLGRLLLYTNGGLAAGLTAGWLGGPWAWHHMGTLGVIGFCAGALLARLGVRGAPAPTTLPGDTVRASEMIASSPQGTGGNRVQVGASRIRPGGDDVQAPGRSDVTR